MKFCFLRITVLALLLLGIVSQVFAESKGKGKATKKAPISVEVPFDDSVEILPAKFKTNNLLSIYSALLKNSGKYNKSEFETNDSFQERLRKLDDAPLTGKLKYDSTVVFPLLASVESTYDADNQIMTVNIPLSSIYDSELNEAISYGSAIEVFTTLSITKKYTGSNAFGMKMKITGNVYDTFALAVKNDNNHINYGGNIALKIPMTPDKAREAKGTGNIIFVGNLLHPYIGNGSNHTSATINSPTEILDRIRYVAMELTGIWYYSVKSGTIYHKESIGSTDTEESNE